MNEREQAEALMKRLDRVEERLDEMFDAVNRLIDRAQGERPKPAEPDEKTGGP